MKELANPKGNIKVFAGGKTSILAEEKDIPNANIIKVPAVLVQSRGIIDFIFYDKPFTFKNEMWAYTSNELVTVKFLYYYLKNNIQYFRQQSLSMGSLPQISQAITENFPVPILPVSVQEDIVKTLDKFESLCNDLTAGLPAEIEARRKQYEYYRDKILSFKELEN